MLDCARGGNYYRAAVQKGGLGRRTPLGAMRAIDIPTLMIWGEEDSAFEKEMTLGTDEYVKNLTIKYLPNVSHWVQQEAPEKANLTLEN